MDLSPIAAAFRSFAETQCRGYSPLYERISLSAAEDVDILELVGSARPGQRRPTLLLAVVHDLLLAGAEHELAAFYPSVNRSSTSPADPAPAFSAFCKEYEPTIRERLETAATQTNEVRRAAALAAGLTWASRHARAPLALIEFGASAGLLLAYDRYHITVGGVSCGPADSPVHIDVPTTGPAPALVANLDVRSKLGIDLAPVDLADGDQRRWLIALTWPEAAADRERLQAAMALVLDDPPTVRHGDAVRECRQVLYEVPASLTPVVFHTTLFTYLDRDQRREFEKAIQDVARERPVCWLPMEAPGFLTTLICPFDIPRDVASDNTRFALCARYLHGTTTTDAALAQVDAYGREIAFLAPN